MGHQILATGTGAGGGGGGDVVGPASSTDNALVRWDGATGKSVQSSTAILSDSGDLTLNGFLTIDQEPTHTTAGSYSIKAKTGNTDTGQGVAYFVPQSGATDMYMAVDLVYKGSPGSKTGRGSCWIDICANSQSEVDSGTYQCLTLGKYRNSVAYVMADDSSGGTTYKLVLNPNGNQVGIGSLTPYASGGLLDIKKSSTYTTEAAGITINTGTNAQEELLLGVDHSANFAYIQSASQGTSFTTVPFYINPNGGATKMGGLLTAYNGIATAGTGVPAIYAAGTVAAQTSRSAAIATYTVGAADGSFEVGGNVNVTASSTHSFSLDCTYTDETNTSRTLILPMAQLAGAFVSGGLVTNVTGTGPYESCPMVIRCKASTAITIRPSAGTFTSVTYNAAAHIKQIQ